MNKFAPTVSDRLSIVWLSDPAVDAEGSDLDAYSHDLDRSHLVIEGEPLTLHLRPLTRRERAIVTDFEPGERTLAALCYDVLAVALVEVTGGEVEYTEADISRRKSRSLGLRRLPDDWAGWDEIPDSAVIDAGVILLEQMGTIRESAKNS